MQALLTSGCIHWIDFVVLLYNRTNTEEGTNQARKQLLSKKGRAIHGLHPITVCTHPTYQDSCLAGHSLDQNDDHCFTASIANRMGLKQKAWQVD